MPPSAADALTQLNAYQAPSAADVLTQSENKYGVGDLQTKVNNLQALSGNLTNAIAAVDPSVTGRTAGTLTTEGQRSALVARERAPVVGQLGTAQQSLTDENNQLNTATGRAKDEAAGITADNQNKYQKLLDTYNIANAREAAQQAAQQEAARQAEAVRQYNQTRLDTNANNAANRAASASSAAATPSSTQRSDGGFDFTNASGQSISARLYAQLTGTSFNTVLKKMAASGDKGAADVLKNGGSSKAYKALTWD